MNETEYTATPMLKPVFVFCKINGIERITEDIQKVYPPEGEIHYWEIHLNDGTKIYATGTVEVIEDKRR